MLNGAKIRGLYYRVMKQGALPLPSADMMYLTGQTLSNQDSVLNRVVGFNGLVGIIGIQKQISGYPGYDVLVPELEKRDIKRQRIILIPQQLVEVGGVMISHTLSEMCAMARFAKKYAIPKVILVAPRFHLLRAFMQGVLALKKHHKKLTLYPALGTPLSWDEKAPHSQGSDPMGIMADILVEEITRIYEYHEKGDIPDIEEVLDYLDYLDYLDDRY